MWRLIGEYLGIMCANIAYFINPECIILGGGVMNRKILYEYTREGFLKTLNGFRAIGDKDGKDFLTNRFSKRLY